MKYNKEIIKQLEHIKNKLDNIKILHNIEFSIFKLLTEKGFVNFNTPIITHGMQEYNHPSVLLTTNLVDRIGYLRHSPQFEKQLIVLSSKEKYMQKAPCFRMGDIGNFNAPYLHQIDLEMPFNLKDTSYSFAAKEVQKTIIAIIEAVILLNNRKLTKIERLSYREAIEKYNTDSPYVWKEGDDIALCIVENPPLFKCINNRVVDTIILPMAQPNWKSAKEVNSFLNNKMSFSQIKNIDVLGYDFILSSKYFHKKNTKSKIRRGIEIAGGSVRINNSELQRYIIKKVRTKFLDSFEPLFALLEHYGKTYDYTAGGAIGLERLGMLLLDSLNISDVQPILWRNGEIPFMRKYE